MNDPFEAEVRQRDAAKGKAPAGITMTQSEWDRRYLLRMLDRERATPPPDALRDADDPAVEVLREAIHAHVCAHNDNQWNDVAVAKAMLTPWVRSALRAALEAATPAEPPAPPTLDVERLARAVSLVMSDLDRTPAPIGIVGTSYWRDRAEAIAAEYERLARE